MILRWERPIFFPERIVKEAEISTATISRINRSLRYGTDGYSAVLERLGSTPGPYDTDENAGTEAAKEDK